uniref:Uncharacterized protein n=1 Tax=Craspedostauros australis TaxID=1486917 RepID=A0A7R9WWP5_9STRA|mmetsp:Transcript_23374/g.65223  ORF Transcript_23374/g.65223 Transcript_23374/m.65223 type:complete len:151 (+) Transcript_23374:683-1135(+)
MNPRPHSSMPLGIRTNKRINQRIHQKGTEHVSANGNNGIDKNATRQYREGSCHQRHVSVNVATVAIIHGDFPASAFLLQMFVPMVLSNHFGVETKQAKEQQRCERRAPSSPWLRRIRQGRLPGSADEAMGDLIRHPFGSCQQHCTCISQS